MLGVWSKSGSSKLWIKQYHIFGPLDGLASPKEIDIPNSIAWILLKLHKHQGGSKNP